MQWTAHRKVAAGLVLATLLPLGGFTAWWAANRTPPRIALPELVEQNTFDVAAWDEGAKVLADERMLMEVRVALDCASIDRTSRVEGTEVALASIVDGRTLADGLRPGWCVLQIEAGDTLFGRHRTEARRTWFVYEGGIIVTEEALRSDGQPPEVTAQGTLKSPGVVARDGGSGIASVTVSARCGEEAWAEVHREDHSERAREVRLPSLLRILDRAMPPSSQPGRCEQRIVVRDHAGRETEAAVAWYRYADRTVSARDIQHDSSPPGLVGTDTFSALALRDGSGIRSLSGEVRCDDGSSYTLPSQDYAAYTREVPLAPMLTGLPPGARCHVQLMDADHAGHAARHALQLFVRPDGAVVLWESLYVYPDGTTVPAGRLYDGEEPRLSGMGRSMSDRKVTASEWAGLQLVDEASGLAEVRLTLDCKRSLSETRRFDGPVYRLALSDLVPDPDAVTRARCAVELAARDHAGNWLEERFRDVRFR